MERVSPKLLIKCRMTVKYDVESDTNVWLGNYEVIVCLSINQAKLHLNKRATLNYLVKVPRKACVYEWLSDNSGIVELCMCCFPRSLAR